MCNNLDSLTERRLFDIAHISERERPLSVNRVRAEQAADPDMSAMPRKRRLAVKMLPVAMCQEPPFAEHPV